MVENEQSEIYTKLYRELKDEYKFKDNLIKMTLKTTLNKEEAINLIMEAD